MSDEYRTLKEVQGRLDHVNAKMAELFGKGVDKLTEPDVEQIRSYNDEATELGKKRDDLRELDAIRARNEMAMRESQTPANALGAPQGKAAPKPQGQVKSLADRVVEHAAFAQRMGKNWRVELSDVELKTLMERTAGYAPETTRTGREVEFALRRPVVADVIPNTTTDQSAVKYMEETTFTNNAATVAEGAAKPESALAFTERSVPVEKIATWIPVTDEQLDDVPGIRATIDNRLVRMLELAEEVQLLTGNGTPPQLQGFLNKSGVQTQAKGSDPVPDAIYKAMTLIRHTGFADPTAAIMHPNDWQDIRLLRTADGIYIWGNPSEAGPERVWGLPVVVTTAETENTALVGDFQMYSEIRRKMGIMVESTNSHSDYFIYNKQVIRAEQRLALVIYRPAAFCKVTGI